MAKFKEFKDLEDEAFFVDFVTDRLRTDWAVITKVANCRTTIDPKLLTLAYQTYMVNLGQYTERLHSENPDHFKRSGALVHALYKAAPVVTVTWPEELDNLRNNMTLGTQHAEAQQIDDFYAFFDDYCNEVMAFDIAFRCCQVYASHPKTYDYDYLHNVCYYMKENTNINVGSFVMIFKSYMA